MRTLPYLIVHNSISLNGAAQGFPADADLHREKAAWFEADACLLSASALPPPNAYRSPEEKKQAAALPLLLVVDTRGQLEGLLHVYREQGGMRDVAALVCKATPSAYIDYLQDRGFPFLQSTGDRVDLAESLSILCETYGVRKVLCDNDPVLANTLIEHHLVKELSLLTYPVIVPHPGKALFQDLDNQHAIALRPREVAPMENGVVWTRYLVDY